MTSTFSTCECQTLLLMDGPLLGFHVDPAAEPITNNEPIPVPLHWQQQVKASIDRGFKLGLPVGAQVTWCHRMVTTRKKSGTPRRTVDMQVLNKHAVRETHHTHPRFTRQYWYIQGPRLRSPMLERVSQCAIPRKSPSHYFHHAMGSVPIQNLTTGLRGVTGRVHQKI